MPDNAPLASPGSRPAETGYTEAGLSLPPSSVFALFAPARLRLMLKMARHELMMGLRSAEFRVAFALALVAVLFSAGGSGTTASLAGYRIWNTITHLFGFMLIVWFSAAACREMFTQSEPLVFSKPQSSEMLVLARFVGNFLLACAALAVLLVIGATAQVIGGGTPFVPSAYGHAFRKSLVPLFYLGSLSFSMSLLFRTPVAGAVVGLYWISILLGRNFLARVLSISYSQNAFIYLFIGLAVLLLAASVYRRERRGRFPAPRGIGAAIAASFVFSGLAAWAVIAPSHDPPLRQNDFYLTMGSQRLQEGMRIPGFWLENQDGKITRLSEFPDHILVVLLWSPDVPESVALLDTLAKIHRDYGVRKVTPVAVCISEEYTTARDFARESGYRFPMVIDKGSRLGAELDSPIAEAFDTEELPFAAITDRSHIVRAALKASSVSDTRLLLSLRDRLKEEPD
ncbi:MAG: redoxin domain-containing protein [Armatimonadetes bacterium]|nr:redoxin domain-containing protein [Armatimonadota bacterium]